MQKSQYKYLSLPAIAAQQKKKKRHLIAGVIIAVFFGVGIVSGLADPQAETRQYLPIYVVLLLPGLWLLWLSWQCGNRLCSRCLSKLRRLKQNPRRKPRTVQLLRRPDRRWGIIQSQGGLTHMKKKLLSALLALALSIASFAAVPITDTAAGTTSTYEVTGGKLFFDSTTGTITGSDKTVTDVTIPDAIDGVPVTAIGTGAFQAREQLRSITFGKNIKTIGEAAFQRCYALERVEFDDALTEIGDYAFRYCEALSDVTMYGESFDPNGYGTAKVGYLAFTDTLLQRPDFSPAYKSSEYYDKLSAIRPTGDYLEDLFAVANSQLGYHEGDWLTEQDGYNKKGCGDYSEMTYWWGEPGEMWCGEYVGWCIAMSSMPREIFRPKYTTDQMIEDWKQTAYAGGTYEIKKGDVILFRYNGGNHVILVESVSVKDGVISVECLNGNHSNDVSRNTYKINAATGKTIDIWESSGGYVDTIFAPDYSAADSVAKYTLSFDANGGTVSLAAKQITDNAFYGIFPEPNWEGHSFDGWYTEKTGGEKITSYQIFKNSANQTLYAHWTDWTAGTTFDKSTGTILSVPYSWEGGKIPATIGGVPVTAIGDTACTYRKNLKTLIVPEGVTSIGQNAFSGNKALTYVRFPSSLRTIGEYAFSSNTALTDRLIIPEGVESIGAQAFASCYGIESVSIPSTIKSIGKYAFMRCARLKDVVFAGNMADITFVRGTFTGTPWLHPNFSYAYRGSEYYKKLQALTLSNEDYAADTILVAESQNGYHEGNNFSQMDGKNEEGNDDFSEMAYFSDSPSYRWLPYEEEYQYGGWCGNFCWWSLAMASIPEEAHAYWNEEEQLEWKDTAYAGKAGGYELKAGDLLNMNIGHWCLVTGVRQEGDYVYVDTWNGNDDNDVNFDTYQLCASDSYNQGLADIYNAPGRQDYGERYQIKGICPYLPDKLKDVTFYTVYFDTNGGNALPEGRETKKVAASSFYGLMPTPTREGYIFDGWYTNPEREYGTKITSYQKTRISHNIRLYAHWRTADEEEEEYDGIPGPGVPKGSEDDPGNPDNPSNPSNPGTNPTNPSEPVVGTRESDYTIDENGIITTTAYDIATAVIPNPIDGITVKGIKQYAFGTRSKLKTVVIPDTCVDIDTYAFWQCMELSSLTISDSVETIGKYAFGCSKYKDGETGRLTSVTIGSGIKKIEESAFWNREELKTVYIRAKEGSVDIADGAFPSGTQIIYGEPPKPSDNPSDPSQPSNPSDKPSQPSDIKASDDPNQQPGQNSGNEDMLLGDVDANHDVDLDDALLTLKVALKIQMLEGEAKTAADVDADGDVTLDDALQVLKYALKIIGEFSRII